MRGVRGGPLTRAIGRTRPQTPTGRGKTAIGRGKMAIAAAKKDAARGSAAAVLAGEVSAAQASEVPVFAVQPLAGAASGARAWAAPNVAGSPLPPNKRNAITDRKAAKSIPKRPPGIGRLRVSTDRTR